MYYLNMTFTTSAGIIPTEWMNEDVTIAEDGSTTSWVTPPDLETTSTGERGTEEEKLTGMKKLFSDLDDILLQKFEGKKNPKLAANLSFYASVGETLALTAALATANEPLPAALAGVTAAVSVANTYFKARAIGKLEEKENANEGTTD